MRFIKIQSEYINFERVETFKQRANIVDITSCGITTTFNFGSHEYAAKAIRAIEARLAEVSYSYCGEVL